MSWQIYVVIEERAELLYHNWPGGGAIASPKSLQLNVNLKMVPVINSHLSRKELPFAHGEWFRNESKMMVFSLLGSNVLQVCLFLNESLALKWGWGETPTQMQRCKEQAALDYQHSYLKFKSDYTSAHTPRVGLRSSDAAEDPPLSLFCMVEWSFCRPISRLCLTSVISQCWRSGLVCVVWAG